MFCIFVQTPILHQTMISKTLHFQTLKVFGHLKKFGFFIGLIILFIGCEEDDPPLFQLSIDVNIQEAGTVAGAGEYTAGSEIVLNATASEGYGFSYWEKEGVLLDSLFETTFVMPENDVVITANFHKSAYNLVVNIIPEEGGVVEGQGDYVHGDPVTLVATTNPFHHFLHWTNQAGEILEEDSVYAFIMPMGNQVINAVFERPQYHLDLFASPHKWGNPADAGYYPWGQEVTVNAMPVDHVEFVHWTDQNDEVISDQESFTFIMPADSVRLTAWFVLSEGFVADLDHRIYPTTTIGSQQWMGKNLAVARYNDGSPIIADEWVDNTEGAVTVYPHQSINGLNSREEVIEAYGKLYNWYAVSNPSGLCPEGWRVPSREDWVHLINYLVTEHDMVNNNSELDKIGVGNALKSCRQTYSPLGQPCHTSVHPRWNTFMHDLPDVHMQVGLDLFDFGALPAGRVLGSGASRDVGISADFWSSDYTDSAHAIWFATTYVDQNLIELQSNKAFGLSVRCIMD